MTTIYWNGNFDTGALTQWSGTQCVAPDRLAVQYVAPGWYFLSARVKPGDFHVPTNGARAECVQARSDLVLREGDDSILDWATCFPAGFPTDARWHVWTQFHQLGGSGSPPIEMTLHGTTLSCRLNGVALWTMAINPGAWMYYSLRVKWSQSASLGWIELWKDGVNVLPRQSGKTLIDTGCYLKAGLYRHKDIALDQTVYHDNYRLEIHRP